MKLVWKTTKIKFLLRLFFLGLNSQTTTNQTFCHMEENFIENSLVSKANKNWSLTHETAVCMYVYVYSS